MHGLNDSLFRSAPVGEGAESLAGGRQQWTRRQAKVRVVVCGGE